MESRKQVFSSLAIPPVSLGYTTVRIYTLDELEEAQMGYSVDPLGNSLVDNAEGSWKKEWLVIGYEDLCGDPIFSYAATQSSLTQKQKTILYTQRFMVKVIGGRSGSPRALRVSHRQ